MHIDAAILNRLVETGRLAGGSPCSSVSARAPNAGARSESADPRTAGAATQFAAVRLPHAQPLAMPLLRKAANRTALCISRVPSGEPSIHFGRVWSEPCRQTRCRAEPSAL